MTKEQIKKKILEKIEQRPYYTKDERTLLEEKLIELGYISDYSICFRKCISLNSLQFHIILYLKNNNIFEHKMYIRDEEEGVIASIRNQQDIDNLQQAFNEMQRDLEILKGVEDE